MVTFSCSTHFCRKYPNSSYYLEDSYSLDLHLSNVCNMHATYEQPEKIHGCKFTPFWFGFVCKLLQRKSISVSLK